MSKKKKNFLPKTIAGVKVPKAVRKGRLGELIASPAGQAAIAEAVMAVGAVAGAKKVKDSPKARSALAEVADRLRDGAGDASHKTGKAASVASGAIAYALGEAARSFAEALQRHDRDADAEAPASAEGWTERSAHETVRDAESSKKKPQSYEAAPH
ncbi:hypothetical protein [Phenylobacterium soli]|uniref:Uncharacterized protein n=1 Tax=Phenylobacterium soli TaxID=2170551 RepID=A0A328APM2_9CAUL|nr:hypothetical protein [Phenylobacterium soli]RAK55444.1 hypothetical protein DJ017_13440 [Phenylobacterium soli]